MKTHTKLLLVALMTLGGVTGLHAQTGCLDCLLATVNSPVDSANVYVSWESQGVAYDSTFQWTGDTTQVVCDSGLVLGSIIAWDQDSNVLMVSDWTLTQTPDTVTMYQVTTDPDLAGVVDTVTANNCTVELIIYAYAPPDPDEGACGTLVPLSGVANDTFRLNFATEVNGPRIIDFEAYGITDEIQFWSESTYHGGAVIGTDGQFDSPILWNGGIITQYSSIPASWDFKIPGAGVGSARFLLDLGGYCELAILVISNPTNASTAYNLFVHCCDTCIPGTQTVVNRNALQCAGDVFLGATLEIDTQLIEVGTTYKGCDSLTIWEVKVPIVEIEAFDVNQPSCYGFANGKVQVIPQASDPFYIAWDNGNQSSINENLTAGTYSVTVTDINGCSTTDSVVVNQPPLLVVEVEKTEPLCFGDHNGKVEAGANGGTPGYEYAWDTGWDEAILDSITSGSYTVTVTDANGCEEIVSTFLPQQDSLQVVMSQEAATCAGIADGSAEATGFGGVGSYTYLWSNGETGKEIDGLLADDYFITVTDTNGCEVMGNILVEAEQADQVYIPNAFSPNGDGINDAFTIFSGACVKEIHSFLVFDRWGEKIFEKYQCLPNDLQEGWDGEFKNESLQPGLYAWFATVEFHSGEVKFYEGGIQLIK